MIVDRKKNNKYCMQYENNKGASARACGTSFPRERFTKVTIGLSLLQQRWHLYFFSCKWVANTS